MTQPADELPRILGMHHTAFRCLDAEQTRAFYENVVGLELAAALTFDEAPGSRDPLQYMHIFFRMGDGNFLAFFDLPDHLERVRFKQTSGFNRHIALKVAGDDELEVYRARFVAAGVPVEGPIDHGFVRSVYTTDPNGIQVEITCPTPEHDSLLAEEGLRARETLAKWTVETYARKAAFQAAP